MTEKPGIDPKAMRAILKYAGMMLAAATAIVALWEQGNLTPEAIAVTILSTLSAASLAKQSEAPGGIAFWELPESTQDAMSSPPPDAPEA